MGLVFVSCVDVLSGGFWYVFEVGIGSFAPGRGKRGESGYSGDVPGGRAERACAEARAEA